MVDDCVNLNVIAEMVADLCNCLQFLLAITAIVGSFTGESGQPPSYNSQQEHSSCLGNSCPRESLVNSILPGVLERCGGAENGIFS